MSFYDLYRFSSKLGSFRANVHALRGGEIRDYTRTAADAGNANISRFPLDRTERPHLSLARSLGVHVRRLVPI
jgi:hypothetical protein